MTNEPFFQCKKLQKQRLKCQRCFCFSQSTSLFCSAFGSINNSHPFFPLKRSSRSPIPNGVSSFSGKASPAVIPGEVDLLASFMQDAQSGDSEILKSCEVCNLFLNINFYYHNLMKSLTSWKKICSNLHRHLWGSMYGKSRNFLSQHPPCSVLMLPHTLKHVNITFRSTWGISLRVCAGCRKPESLT